MRFRWIICLFLPTTIYSASYRFYIIYINHGKLWNLKVTVSSTFTPYIVNFFLYFDNWKLEVIPKWDSAFFSFINWRWYWDLIYITTFFGKSISLKSVDDHSICLFIFTSIELCWVFCLIYVFFGRHFPKRKLWVAQKDTDFCLLGLEFVQRAIACNFEFTVNFFSLCFPDFRPSNAPLSPNLLEPRFFFFAFRKPILGSCGAWIFFWKYVKRKR